MKRGWVSEGRFGENRRWWDQWRLQMHSRAVTGARDTARMPSTPSASNPMLSPDALMLASVLRGVRPPADVVARSPEGRRISYCELGCGQGLTLNILAARDPVDTISGSTTTRLRSAMPGTMAEAQGIQNLTLIEDSFAELDLAQLPEFDIIVLHGIYSWVAPAIRASIVNFIRRKLKLADSATFPTTAPSGGAPTGPCASCCLPPAAISRVRRLSRLPGAQHGTGIAKGDSRYFERHQVTREHLEHLKRHQPTYNLHEYFGDSGCSSSLTRLPSSWMARSFRSWPTPTLSGTAPTYA